MRKRKLEKDIETLKAVLNHAEEYLFEIDELIRLKGTAQSSYKRSRNADTSFNDRQ